MNDSPKSRNELLLEAYSVANFASGRMAWTQFTPIEWRDRDERWMAELKTTVGGKCSGSQARDQAQSDFARVARVASLGTLAASIAHELTQPLAGIVANTMTCQCMLAAAPPDIGGAIEAARRTLRDVNRASEVITRLRTLFNRGTLAAECVDLNEAVREVLELSLNELRTNKVVVRMRLATKLPLVTGDHVQLQQVILNLLRNAAEAMSAVEDRPRELLISTERLAGAQVRLSVKDVGVGLPASGADRLFEAFFTTKHDGMGIGLSLSRSIIESHHGRLWATRNDGPGSTFWFSIPCGGEAGPSREEANPAYARSE